MPNTTDDKKFNWDEEYKAVMEDQVVTNISEWTEPNYDTPCDENAYRKRLEKNAPIINKKISEALDFE